jgi:mannose-6-phosphate isomerase class I
VHTRTAGHGPDALIGLEGTARLESDGASVPLHRGQIVMAPDPVAYTLIAEQAPATLYRAAIPPSR